jgi:hypothetical protein
MNKERKSISRIDHKRTHGYLARVYRAEWVGSKSFADLQYSGQEVAEKAAWKWVKFADARLPKIPPKPVLKVAKFRLRKDGRGRHYEVYLPQPGKGKHEVKRLRFLDEFALALYRDQFGPFGKLIIVLPKRTVQDYQDALTKKPNPAYIPVKFATAAQRTFVLRHTKPEERALALLRYAEWKVQKERSVRS